MAARAVTLAPAGSPVLTAVQLSPWSVERKTALTGPERGVVDIPAKRFVPLTANAVTGALVGKPALTRVQLPPWFVERKTPLSLIRPPVAAKMFVPTTANEDTD